MRLRRRKPAPQLAPSAPLSEEQARMAVGYPGSLEHPAKRRIERANEIAAEMQGPKAQYQGRRRNDV